MKIVKNILIWFFITAYLIVIFGFINKENDLEICKSIDISIVDNSDNYFIEEEEVLTRLQNKGADNWSDAEKARWDAAEAVWKKIEDVRTVSDTLEASISGMNSDQLHAFARNIVKNSAWD